ncbi:MAG: sensor domain-containing diguanylate cyclase, partial [Actinoplanes sp.]
MARASAATRDPILVGLLAVAGLILLGYLAPVGGSWGRLLVFWPIQVALDIMMTLGALRVVRVPGISRTTRRFWRSMLVSGMLLTLGDCVQTAVSLPHIGPAILNSSNIQLVLIAAGVSCPVWAMLTHPIPGLGRERLRFWLDAGATMIAAAVFVWILLAGDGSGRSLLLFAVSAGLLLVTAFGVVKLMLADNPPFNRAAALAGGLGACVTGIATVIQPPLVHTWMFDAFMAGKLLPCVLLAACARFEERGLRATGDVAAPSRGRRHSRLPYLAAAAAQLLMIILLLRSGLSVKLAGGLIGVTLVVTLVIVRQLVTFTDVDALATEVSRQEQRFRALVRDASDIILIVDQGGLFTYASPALHRVLGLSIDAVVGTSVIDVLHPDDVPLARDVLVRAAAEPGTGVSWQARARHSDGGWRWLEIISTDRLDDPSVEGVIANARDITLARDLARQTRHQATHDQLTGLANRLLFTERLDRIALDGDDGSPVGMLVIDLNDFKPINDDLGHQAGDAVLIAVAERLTACSRNTDTVARLGGDEFAVILCPATEVEAEMVADRIRAAVARPIHVAGRDLVVGA